MPIGKKVEHAWPGLRVEEGTVPANQVPRRVYDDLADNNLESKEHNLKNGDAQLGIIITDANHVDLQVFTNDQPHRSGRKSS
jgi:hypothetical protein